MTFERHQLIIFTNSIIWYYKHYLLLFITGGKCSIRCCTADLCNTQCNTPSRLSNEPTNSPPVQSLPKEKDITAGTSKLPSVHTAEFVSQPDLQNTHFPKGHDWSFGHSDVTETSSSKSKYNPKVSNNVDQQGIQMPNVNSESQGILATLGISELPGQTNTSAHVHVKPNIKGTNNWDPINQQASAQRVNGGWTEMNVAGLSSTPSSASRQIFEPHGMADQHQHHSPNENINTPNSNVPKRNQDFQSTTIASAKNIDQTLNTRVLEVYGRRAPLNAAPQSMENNNNFESHSQTYSGLQGHHNSRPVITEYTPDRQPNVEEQFLSQHNHNTQSSNSAISNPDAGYALDSPHDVGGHHQHINKPSGMEEKHQSQSNTHNVPNAAPDKSYSGIPSAEKYNPRTHQEYILPPHLPSGQHDTNTASRNTGPSGVGLTYNSQHTNLNVDNNHRSNKSAPNYLENPGYVDPYSPAANQILTPQLHSQFEFLTEAQRQRVLQVINSRVQSDTYDITANQRSGGLHSDASENIEKNRPVQQNSYPSNAAQTGLDRNRMQDVPNSLTPNTLPNTARIPSGSNLPTKNLDLYQTDANTNANPSVMNVHTGGSNRLSTDFIDAMTHNNNAEPVSRGLRDKTGILNAKENTFSARNRNAPWTQNKKSKKVSTTVDNHYQNNFYHGPVHSRRNVIGETTKYAKKNGPTAESLANLRSQPNSWNNVNNHQVPVTPLSPQSTNIQQMSDPRNSAGLSGVVGAAGEMPYPELLNPARGQAPQGIKHIQRITGAGTSADYNPTYQKYPIETFDKSHSVETRRFGAGKNMNRQHTFEKPKSRDAGNTPARWNHNDMKQRHTFDKTDTMGASRFRTGMNLNVNWARNVEHPVTVIPPVPVSGYPDSLTPPPSVDILSMKVAYPCLRNPCVRGTCREAYGTYKCKCETGFWGKNCEQCKNIITLFAATCIFVLCLMTSCFTIMYLCLIQRFWLMYKVYLYYFSIVTFLIW